LVCKNSHFQEGKDNLIQTKKEVMSAKCVVIENCRSCPSFIWTGTGICTKMNKMLNQEDSIPEWCPIDSFKDWQKTIWGA
jgi:hypothetical protein